MRCGFQIYCHMKIVLLGNAGAGKSTVAQLFAHLADGQYEVCGAAIEGKPVDKGVEKTAKGKAEIVKALNEAFAYCEATYAGRTAR